MRRVRFPSGAILPAALSIVAIMTVPASAQQERTGSAEVGSNVLITLTISKTGGSGESANSQRVYKFIGQDNSDAKMLVGWRTPMPMVSAAKDSEGKPSMTSFVYQNDAVDELCLVLCEIVVAEPARQAEVVAQ